MNDLARVRRGRSRVMVALSMLVGGASALAPAASGAPTLEEPKLSLRSAVDGLQLPTSIAFLGPDDSAGNCDAFFPVGTIVKLDARPATDSSFLGWRQSVPGCRDASKITVACGTTITCQPAFVLR